MPTFNTLVSSGLYPWFCRLVLGILCSGLGAWQAFGQVVIPADEAIPLRFESVADPGFVWKIHQSSGSTLPNTIRRAEEQLSGRLGSNLALAEFFGPALGAGSPVDPGFGPIRFELAGVVDFEQAGNPAGVMRDDQPFPGIPPQNADNLAGEVSGWLGLTTGDYEFRVNSDDGFRMTLGGSSPEDRLGTEIGKWDGGRTADVASILRFRINKDGLYPMRLVWEEGFGDASLELYQRLADGRLVYVNGPEGEAVRAFRAVLIETPGYVVRTLPLPGETGVWPTSAIEIDLVDVGVVTMRFDGSDVAAEQRRTGNRTFLVYRPPEPFVSGSQHTVTVAYETFAGMKQRDWSFTVIPYGTLTPSMRVTVPDPKPGFQWTVFQNDARQEATLSRAEEALGGSLTRDGVRLANHADPSQAGAASAPGIRVLPMYPSGYRFSIPEVINLSQLPGGSQGNFGGDRGLPGIPGTNGGTDGIAAEILSLVSLPAGWVTLGVNSDDGFRMTGGPSGNPRQVLLGEFEGGRSATDSQFPVRVEAPGFYTLRTVWYEAGGDASIEIFSVETNGLRRLVNDVTRGGLRSVLPPVSVPPASLSFGYELGQGLHLVTVPLTVGSNRVQEIWPAMPAGTRFQKFENAAQEWGPVETYFEGTGWRPGTTRIRPGEGGWLNLPSGGLFRTEGIVVEPLPAPFQPPASCWVRGSPHIWSATYAELVSRPPAKGTTVYRHDRQSGLVELAKHDGGNWLPLDWRVDPGRAVFVCQPGGTPKPVVPWLSVIGLLGGAAEDAPFSVSHGAMAAAADESDLVVDAVAFRVEKVLSGKLRHGDGSGVIEGSSILGSGDNWTWIPPSNESGVLPAFTVRAWNGANASAIPIAVRIAVQPVNDAPSLTVFSDRLVPEGNGPLELPFEIDDVETAAADLIVAVTSSNQAVVPNAALVVGGSGRQRRLNVSWTFPIPGETRIRVSVVDPGGASSSSEFKLTVEGDRTAGPVLEQLGDYATPRSVPFIVPLRVTDQDTPIESLTRRWSTSDTNVVRQLLFVSTPDSPMAIRVIPGAVSGLATVTVTLGDGRREASRTFRVLVQDGSDPIRIESQPEGFVATPGETRILSVLADGAPPLRYVWRCNGQVIAGATGSRLVLTNIQPESGGSYSVVVHNARGVRTSAKAFVTVEIPTIGSLVDNWPPPTSVAGEGYLRGSNLTARRQPGESDHAGKPGGKSMWFVWSPSESGIATIRTHGSTFDTLLAVYRGNPLASNGPELVAFDEDSEGAGPSCFNSQVRFNAEAGVAYSVAIDGYYGATGEIAVRVQLEATKERIPVIRRQPASLAVPLGAPEAVLDIDAADPTGAQVAYQWFRNRLAIQGATNSILRLPGPIDVHAVGTYHATVELESRIIASGKADLEISTYAPPLAVIESRDLYGWKSLVWKLRQAEEPVAQYLFSRFDASVKADIENGTTSDNPTNSARERLSVALSAIVQGGSIHEPTRFAGVQLRSETRRLLERTPQGVDLARLNRLLLEDAFPSEIASRRDLGVVSHDKVHDAVSRLRTRNPAGDGDGRVGLAMTGSGGSGAAVPVYPGTPVSHLMGNRESSTQEDEQHACDVVMQQTRWIGIAIDRPGLLVADTLGSEVDSVLTFYRDPGGVALPIDFPLLACNSDAVNATPPVKWSLVALDVREPGTYYAQIDATNQTGLIQFNSLLLTNSTMAMLGVHVFLTNRTVNVRPFIPTIPPTTLVPSLDWKTNRPVRLAASPGSAPWRLERSSGAPGVNQGARVAIETVPVGIQTPWLQVFWPEIGEGARAEPPWFYRAVK